MSSFQRAREALGRQLREIREQAGLNGKEFAGRLGWQPAKVSRIETGQRTPSRADIAQWTGQAGVPERAEELNIRVASLDEMFAVWQRQLRSGMSGRQRESRDVEGQTRLLRIWEPGIVPGLLQTPDYARAIFEANAGLYGYRADIEDAVAARMDRQHILYESGRRIHFVVTEGGLRNPPVPADAMKAQLDRLVSASALSTVALGVIPLDAQLPLPLKANFWIYDEDRVVTEVISAELTVTDPSEVAMYVRTFTVLADVALYGEAARQRLIGMQATFADN